MHKMVLLRGALDAKRIVRLCMQMWHWHASGLIVKYDSLVWTPVIIRTEEHNVYFPFQTTTPSKVEKRWKKKYSKPIAGIHEMNEYIYIHN